MTALEFLLWLAIGAVLVCFITLFLHLKVYPAFEASMGVGFGAGLIVGFVVSRLVFEE